MSWCVTWKREQTTEGQYLVKTFEFEDFNQLHTFLSKITLAGTVLGHDAEALPSQSIDGTLKRTMTLRLTTNDAGKTVTDLDYLTSKVIDRAYSLMDK